MRKSDHNFAALLPKLLSGEKDVSTLECLAEEVA